MAQEIRIYIEGGGDTNNTKRTLRLGLDEFFKEIHKKAKQKNIKFSIIPSGSDGSSYKNFQRALQSHPDAFNVLLVDSDTAVTTTPRQHLNRWDFSNVSDDQIHLMVQIMESWYLAHVEALKDFYGQGFQDKALPKNPKVEEIPKNDVYDGLIKATKNTSKKTYNKILHASEILKKLEAKKARKAAPHCESLFHTLEEKIEE
jgi:hypothetical protein